MKAIVTREFSGRPDHEPLPRSIAVGEVIEGDLAAVAIAAGDAEAVEEAGKPEAAPQVDAAAAKRASKGQK